MPDERQRDFDAEPSGFDGLPNGFGHKMNYLKWIKNVDY